MPAPPPALPEPLAEPVPLGRDEHTDGGGAFHRGLRSITWLGRSAYNILKRTHKWRLDSWDRINNLSWSLVLILRHANSYERERPVRLNSDGTLSIEDLKEFQIIWVLKAQRPDFEELRRQNRMSQKKRFFCKDDHRGERAADHRRPCKTSARRLKDHRLRRTRC